MKCRVVLSWLLVIMACAGVCAAAEEEVPATFPPQQVELEAFTFFIGYDWIVKELTDGDAENGVLLQADRVDGLYSLMVFAGGEGDVDSIRELTARNEYAGIAKRERPQIYNNIEIIFTSSEETGSATAYISENGVIYSFLLRGMRQEDEAAEEGLEILQGFLLSLTVSE